jgi:glycine cleavage system aminomethyltransferase T
MAVGAWITHAGGVGKAVAELITEGEAEWDLREASIDRFHAHQFTGEYIRVVTEKNYREVYDIRHPQEPPTAPRDVRLSPFAPRLASLGPHNIPFGGIELAAWYDANQVLTGRYPEQLPARSEWASLHWSPIAGAEHLACRDKAALFDLTGLSIIEVGGGQAVEFVNYLCSNQMNVSPGRVVYTLWLTPAGRVKRDLAVARLGPDRFWMFVGEGTRPQDVAWARRHVSAFPQVTLTDISDAYTALGLWGPDAPALLEDLTGGSLDLGYFRGDWIEVGQAPVYCMRLSYVGEAGFELHIPVDQALPVFDRLWESGKSRGLVMAGSTAMNSLRIEKGYRLWGADIHTEHDPYQAGLGWTVALDKEEDFLGSGPCRERADTDPVRRLACLVLDEGDPLGNEAVLYGGSPIGHVTSSAFGHSIGAAVAYAYLPTEQAEPGTEVDVLVEGKPRRAVVSPEPLWDPGGTRLRHIHPGR